MSLLTRSILLELLSVLLLTCGVLVSVIAFGAAIRPLAQNLLGPIDAMKYIALATVPMLQFALPFSAGFAATLVLHRLAGDNELLAMSAAGLSYGRILRPVMVLAAALLVTMAILTAFVIPRFWILLDATVRRDVTRLFVSSVNDRQALTVGNLQIYADEVHTAEPAAGSGAESRLQLAGVAGVQVDGAGNRVTEFTAELATVDVYLTDGGVYLKLALVNASIFREADGTAAFLPRALPDAIRASTPAALAPSQMTVPQILALRRDLDAYPPVEERRRGLFGVVREAGTWKHIGETLARGEPVTLEDGRGRARYELRGGALEGRAVVPAPGERVAVVERVDGKPLREATAPQAVLSIDRQHDRFGQLALADELDMTVKLTLPDATVQGADGESDSTRWPWRLTGLRLVGEPAAPAVTPSRAELAVAASTVGTGLGPRAELIEEAARWSEAIDKQTTRTRNETTARLSQRAALSVSALLLTMLGAVLAAWRRRSMPLEIYLLAFIPSIATILLISGGEQSIRGGRVVEGLLTMWSGNGALAALLAFVWHRMARH